ncbi:MAG: hypothetical protein H0V41_09960 [Pseudonocardiales bacterium]|nr:hypothetical protein [Pseudonocardiales bacterium]
MVAPSLLDNVKTEIDTASELGSPATVIVDDGSPTASAPLVLKTAKRQPSLPARSGQTTQKRKTTVVIDSGLQTTGALRFQDQDGRCSTRALKWSSSSDELSAAQPRRNARRIHRAR